MKIHTEMPKSGKGRKIWKKLTSMFKREPDELWYNPNNWGRSSEQGWGTWAFKIGGDEGFCGCDNHGVYVQQMTAPYRRFYVH